MVSAVATSRPLLGQRWQGQQLHQVCDSIKAQSTKARGKNLVQLFCMVSLTYVSNWLWKP
uniref:Uncharacterized protein n=1 Tax=Arundo donax TaxID=35708 RepID=A0A0A9DXI5_ARUDO